MTVRQIDEANAIEAIRAAVRDGGWGAITRLSLASGVSRPTIRSVVEGDGKPSTINRILAHCAAAKGGEKPIPPRVEKMASMYRQGLTLEKIGGQFGVTRERVRQLLKRWGVTRHEGGASVRGAARAASRKRNLDAKSLLKWGVSFDERRQHRRSGALGAFEQQRNSANHRGITWNLSFADWWSIWQASGKWEQRGRGKDCYVMSRIRDDGPYEVGNVHIQTLQENSREAVAKWRGKTKKHRGVFNVVPGLQRPFLATYGKVRLGYYATAEEAAWARASYLETRDHLDVEMSPPHAELRAA